MSSDPFDLLGLDRKTASDADVRRAYAERLKLTRPEDDREGFMALRAAFEQARESVRWRDHYGDYDDDDEVGNDDNEDGAEDQTAPDPVAAPGAAEEDLTFAEDAGGLILAETEEEAEAEPERDPVEGAMTALIGAMTDSPFGASVTTVMRIIEADAISGIDEFQTMQSRLRNFLCDRTGYNLEPAEVRQPEWLTLKVFEALDSYYGWTRQPAVTEPWVRRQNDWLARVRKDIGLSALPKDERKKAELSKALEELGHGGAEMDTGTGRGGSLRWLFIGVGVIVYGLIQFLIRAGGG